MSFDKTLHQVVWLPVKNLSVVWSQSQRELDEKRVDTLADEFDPDLFDSIIVTLPNGDGIYHVVDGQHRKALIQKLYGETEQVPCRMVRAEDPVRAAQIWDRINNGQKKPNAVEKFLVRVTAKNEVEVDIQRIISGLGYRVANHKGDMIICAVGALGTVYKTFGADILKEALQTIKATWNEDQHAMESRIIQGYGALIAKHRGHLDFKRLRDRIGKTFTPGQLVARAKHIQEMENVRAAEGVMKVLVRAYNDGLRTPAGKLA